MSKLVRFSIGLDEEIVRRMDEVCEKWGLQRADLVRMIVADWYQQKREFTVAQKSK